MKKTFIYSLLLSLCFLLAACAAQNTTVTTTKTVVSKNRWFTCYVQNKRRSGVWSATSHHRKKAVKWAYKRCVRFSHHPRKCYVSYCRIW